MSDEMRRTLTCMDRIRRVMADELRMLMESPDNFRMAQALADAFEKSLMYLFHFEYLVAHDGRGVDAQEVIDKITGHFREDFKNFTGRDYRPEVCRQMDLKREDKRRAAQRLMDKIMEADPDEPEDAE